MCEDGKRLRGKEAATQVNRRRLIVLASSALTMKHVAASAQSKYPDRPIRLIVPFVPGGVVDVVARLWADKMTSLLGTVVIENRGGASGLIGAAEVARSQPDGYTVLLGNTSTQVLNPMITSNPPYDAAKDFAAIGIIANSVISIAVHPSLPVRNLSELTAYIKSHPRTISYGSPGAGTFTNLAGEMYKESARTSDLTHVPYKGGGQVITDVVSGHIPMMVVAITNQIWNCTLRARSESSRCSADGAWRLSLTFRPRQRSIRASSRSSFWDCLLRPRRRDPLSSAWPRPTARRSRVMISRASS